MLIVCLTKVHLLTEAVREWWNLCEIWGEKLQQWYSSWRGLWKRGRSWSRTRSSCLLRGWLLRCRRSSRATGTLKTLAKDRHTGAVCFLMYFYFDTDSRNVWMLCKTENSHLLVLYDINSVEIIQRQLRQIVNVLDIFINWIYFLEFYATTLSRSWDRGNKSPGKLKNTYLEPVSLGLSLSAVKVQKPASNISAYSSKTVLHFAYLTTNGGQLFISILSHSCLLRIAVSVLTSSKMTITL